MRTAAFDPPTLTALFAPVLVLAAALAAAAPAAAAQPPSRFVCTGSRPAFELDVSREQVRFVDVHGKVHELRGSFAAEMKYGGFVWRASSAAEAPQLVAFGIEQACETDGAEKLPYLLYLSQADGRLLQGCCEPAAGPVAGAMDALSIGGFARLVGAAGGVSLLRAGPAVREHNVIAELPAAEVVKIKGFRAVEEETWYLVEQPETEKDGWVRAVDLEPVPLPGRERVKEADDWSRELMHLLPGIGACLEDLSPGRPAVVTSATPLRMGMAAVRVKNDEGKRWNCVVSLSSGKISRAEVMPEGLELPGDGDPLFTRADRPRPEGPCWSHEESVDPISGKLLGWLSYRREGCKETTAVEESGPGGGGERP